MTHPTEKAESSEPVRWAAEINDTEARIYNDDNFAETIAWVPADTIGEDNREHLSADGKARAKLIAASPEMREALLAAGHALQMAIEALERSGGAPQLGPKGRDRMLMSALRVASTMATGAIMKSEVGHAR